VETFSYSEQERKTRLANEGGGSDNKYRRGIG